MPEGMLGMLPLSDLRGPRDTLETNLAGKDGQEWLDALNRFLRKENPWEKPKLLRLLGSTTVPDRVTAFIARDHFKVAKGKEDKVKISFIGDNFTTYFLSGNSKAEAPAVAHELAHHELTKRSLDVPIVTELGGEAPAESTLADIWTKMEAQGGGEDGDLLTKNYAANIFYVRDTAGVLRVVYVDWHGVGWYVDAVPVSNPYEWGARFRVFASNSVPSTI